MSDGSSNLEDLDRHNSIGAINFLEKAFCEGRPIIPFLGAGVSAGSGFPLTDGLRNYLCKVKFFIRYSVYRRLLGDSTPPHNHLRPDFYEFNPAEYLVDFGWPDYNRLTADLWSYAENPDPPSVIGYSDDQKWWTEIRSR